MLRKSVVLFMQKKRNILDPIGSGTFVFHDGALYIVSAAHVFEDLKGPVAAYVHVVDKIFSLVNINVFVSNKEPFQNDRTRDSFDLGAMLVPEEILDYCNGHISFIQQDLIENDRNRDAIIGYQVIGYPGFKNSRLAKKAVYTNEPFIPEALVYSGHFMERAIKENPRFTNRFHIAINFEEKNNKNDDGVRVDAPKPEGMSGGLIQGCFYYVPHSEGMYHTCASGILIELDQANRSFIGVRFDAVYEWLERHSSHFAKP